MTTARALLSLLLIGTFAGAASATDLSVELGWDGSYRQLRWSPVFITAADSKPRNVVVELYVPHDMLQSMNIRQMLTIGPTPTTIALYVPLGGRLDEVSVTLRDPNNRGKTLKKWVNDPSYNAGAITFTEPTHQLIGISGRSGPKRLIESHFDQQVVVVKSIAMNRLPAVARGYESFSTLMLDQPDLTRLSVEQQHAMIDWIRSGGHLVLWLGEDQLPASSPILQQLPAVVGENTSITVSSGAVEEAGLPERFSNMKGRTLTPTADASRIPLFNGEVQAFKRTLGLGAIVIVPFDCSTLLINDQKQAAKFWKPLLDGTIDLTKRDDDRQTTYYGHNDTSQQRRSNAARMLMNQLGDVPGAGSFGFSWVAIVMLGLMLVVGPVDWIVLKRLGRQPWTWVTTSGWIALVTLGALYLGHILKSGELHYHTARMIDQAGDSTVAVTDTVGIYSPRTAAYELTVSPEGWWEPLSADTYFYRSGTRSDINFHQDYRGNTPEPMVINVWNLRFLTSDTIGTGPPMIEADLRHDDRGPGQSYIVGTIKNLSDRPLNNVSIRCSHGHCFIGTAIAPGASMQVEERLSKAPPPSTQYGSYGAYVDTTAVGIEQYFRLAIERTSRIDRLVASRNVVVVYAASEGATPSPQLVPAPTVEKHHRMVRAVFPLRRTNP